MARVRVDRRAGPPLTAWIAFAAALAVLTSSGCHRQQTPAPPPPLPVLGEIRIADVSEAADGAPPAFDVQTLEAPLRDRLLASGLFGRGTDGGAGPVAGLQVRIASELVETRIAGEARVRVGLRLDSRPEEAPGALAFALEGQGSTRYGVAPASRKRPPVPPPDRRPMFHDLALRIADDLIDGFVTRHRLHEGAPSAVHAALQADGGDLRDEAIRVVGERQLHDEAPILLKLLNDPEESTRDAALGALIALGDRRAVTELTRTRSLRDRREMRKIIEAIAILGGREADEYLSFVAATHDDDEIRAEAAAARARLERRESDAGATAAQ